MKTEDDETIEEIILEIAEACTHEAVKASLLGVYRSYERTGKSRNEYRLGLRRIIALIEIYERLKKDSQYDSKKH